MSADQPAEVDVKPRPGTEATAGHAATLRATPDTARHRLGPGLAVTETNRPESGGVDRHATDLLRSEVDGATVVPA